MKNEPDDAGDRPLLPPTQDLTADEIEALRRNKQRISAYVREQLRKHPLQVDD